MSKLNNVLEIIDIPEDEKVKFDKLIKDYRAQYIRKPAEIVVEVFEQYDFVNEITKKKNVSEPIAQARELAWQKFLEEEAKFNTTLLRDLYKKLNTPEQIIDVLIKSKVHNKKGNKLIEAVKEVCGEYSGHVYPYIYTLSLSNTNSRRSRSGSTFEAIIYTIYDILGYPYDSQRKVGKKVFHDAGLGKKVDSVLPGLDEFRKRRNKTIIGTMKTSLRERWQEVAEEIERTQIPEIHLLTVDSHIASNKASEMGVHNIVVVTYKDLAENNHLETFKNIISFEEYFFDEIPQYLHYWKK